MTITPKHLRSHPAIAMSGRHLKRYDVTLVSPADGGGIDPRVEEAALAMLPNLLPEPDASTPPGSWVVLHQGADGSSYLNAYSWVWGNVVEVRAAAAAQPFVGCPDDDPANFVPLDRPWVGCTWELGPFDHERRAWLRHIWAGAEADLEAYLRDYLPDGPTGHL